MLLLWVKDAARGIKSEPSGGDRKTPASQDHNKNKNKNNQGNNNLDAHLDINTNHSHLEDNNNNQAHLQCRLSTEAFTAFGVGWCLT